MKILKKYTAPKARLINVASATLLAGSVSTGENNLNDEEIDGGNALSKGNFWNWTDEEE